MFDGMRVASLPHLPLTSAARPGIAANSQQRHKRVRMREARAVLTGLRFKRQDGDGAKSRESSRVPTRRGCIGNDVHGSGYVGGFRPLIGNHNGSLGARRDRVALRVKQSATGVDEINLEAVDID